MLTPLTKLMEGQEFTFMAMPPMVVLKLSRKVLTVLSPLVGGLDDLDMAADINMESMARALTSALTSLSDADLTNLLQSTLAYVQWTGPEGVGVVELGKESTINMAFTGQFELMLQVAVEAWRFNKFPPFAQLERFGGLEKILTSKKAAHGKEKSGLKLERSAPSTPT